MILLLIRLFRLPPQWSLSYIDDEGDAITVVDSIDWNLALSLGKGKSLLRIRITPISSSSASLPLPTLSAQSQPEIDETRSSQSPQVLSTPKAHEEVQTDTPAILSKEPSTIRESCDLESRNLQTSVSEIHRGMASECNMTFNDTLARCNSIYDSERDHYSRIDPPSFTPLYEEIVSECDKAVQSVIQKHHECDGQTQPKPEDFVVKDVDDSVQEMLSRMANVSLQITEQCKQLSDDIVQTAMKL